MGKLSVVVTLRLLAAAAYCLLTTAAQAAAAPEWKHSQDLQVAQPGLVRAMIPLETLSNAQPALTDLRLMDAAGQEVPYFIDQPMVQRSRQLPLSPMRITMGKGKTIITGEVPQEMLSLGFDAIHLYSATDDFLKPLTLEGSRDGQRWTTLINAYPIYKQPGEPASTRIEFPKSNFPHLRLTLDDTATPPIRVQGVQLYSAPKKLTSLQTVPLQILETASDAHQTDVHLLLPAGNLTIDAIRLETPEGTFRRRVMASVKTFSAGEFRENLFGQGYVYRVALNQKSAERLEIPLGRQIPGRQLILRIENGDSPPLTITRITAEVIPAFLVFSAPAAGGYALWVGNPAAGVRTYDVAGLRDKLAGQNFISGAFGPLALNPTYRPAEPMPQVAEEGTAIDLTPWHYRKPILLNGQGRIWRIEPDLDVLSNNAGRLAALRVIRDGKQLPYIVDTAGVSREVAIDVAEEAGAKGSISRWTLTLPKKALPLSTLRFSVQEPLFQRIVTLYEETLDERGDARRQVIGAGVWTRTGADAKQEFTIALYRRTESDKLFLETDNQDNAPIHLTAARGFYQTPRLLVKASPGKELFLYYGQEAASSPQYDIALVAAEMLAAPPAEAALGAEEVLKVQPWWEAPVPTGAMKYAFWTLMALVVIGLLVIIGKLLPAEV